MTTADINKILSQLAATPSRDNVLDFAFALLQWMNITPNAGQKPQLISPQTQKLKDFLATAPQTVQPQLYRLSADNQNIRVRFAVLKKLKKDYISQLVDNDPGLGSYQSMIKGITTNNKGFVPSQPYFIHFVTTPDYDKLVLVFNQGEQKRIVSFRNRLTSTQYNKIILQWQGAGTKSKPEIADLLWKSLDIKEVNKEFYKQIKERFDALLGIVKTQDAVATESQVKQFSVRLIGRYIFCWFLKEKGIIPTSLISSDAIRNTENYYQSILLPLFFKTLNTKVQDREILKSCNPKNQGSDNIPYLNGGLFDESNEDKLFTTLNLDAWLLPFVEILESYDFTVDESSSQYQQVAVDPEMLGRIFENLLASQNEETEKLANQRKAFGAFYTPREIVDYMVNESLKAYLQTQWEGESEKVKEKSEKWKEEIEKKVEPLFNVNVEVSHLKKEEKTLLLSFLEKIKILDPACGSGAFPMGILQKLVELHEALGTVKSRYELKKDILSRNIHGVDIMPMAIEIARLRAWLSLVLEETYNPKDPVHNFGVKPLPNLDFKFVCANSLIDLGLDSFIQQSKGTLHEGFTEKLVKQLKELEDLRKHFFAPALESTEKEKLKAQYFSERDKVVKAIEEGGDPVLIQIAQKIKHWNPFDDSLPSTFFSPTWMFGIDKGFDVVIGNPPYVPMESLSKELRVQYKKKYNLFQRKYETSVLFIVDGLSKLNKNGVLSFIAPMTWQTGENYSQFRKFILKEKGIISILNLPFDMFEAAYVDTGVYLLSNVPLESYSLFSFEKKDREMNLLNIKYEKMEVDKINEPDYKLILDSNINSIISHLDNEKFTKLGLITKSTQGLSRSQFKEIDKNAQGENVFPFLEKGNVFNYQLKIEKIYKTDISDKKNLKQFYQEEPKVLIRRIINRQDRLTVGYCNKRMVFKKDINPFIPIDENYSAKYLLAILASDLISKLYINSSSIATKDDFRQTTLSELRKLPIPKNVSKEEQIQIENLVDKILKNKKANQDTTALEKEIDVLVYKLYELTYEEVKIIDPAFELSEAAYKNFKPAE